MSASYQPTNRRPIAGVFRRTADLAVRLCVRAGIGADVISYLSIVASGAAACCFGFSLRYPLLLLVGPLFCYLRLWCNMLDGMVALASHTASRRGEILNDLPDRISDVLIFAGLAHSGWVAVPWGYWAAILALMTAYVGTLGQAVAGRREYGGMMSKPWRMVVLHVGAWATFLVYCSGISFRWARLSVLDWTCLILIAGCVQTIGVRLRSTMRELRK